MGMKRFVLRVVLPVLGIAAGLFVGITWYALESSDVAIVATREAEGGIRRTHVWYVESNGELWIEAGRPENSWFVDVTREPRLQFFAEGRRGLFRAEAARDPEAHARLRALIRSKYGWRDAWVALYVDQSRSLAVRLLPAP